MSLVIGQKVQHADKSSVSIAPTATAAKSVPAVATAHVLTNSASRTYFVGGKFVSTEVCDVSYDDTPIKNSQAISGLIVVS